MRKHEMALENGLFPGNGHRGTSADAETLGCRFANDCQFETVIRADQPDECAAGLVTVGVIDAPGLVDVANDASSTVGRMTF